MSILHSVFILYQNPASLKCFRIQKHFLSQRMLPVFFQIRPEPVDFPSFLVKPYRLLYLSQHLHRLNKLLRQILEQTTSHRHRFIRMFHEFFHHFMNANEKQLKILFLRLPQVFSSGGTVIGMSFLCLHGVIKIHISLTKGSFIDHSCPCGPLPLWTGLSLWLPHRIKCMGMIFQQLISFINLLRTPDMLRLF